ncbi:uncharacterized protein B0H18DRAFT_1016384 [Fomitopsis serialis]|uniref:uncharacterized protein n=1 Tax=Fomitopsis serialis TaxID=139415 RepID=UPI0020074E18|nr:uncharacterized protein B0H18DRAFT_1016384 [Neoantrodia serialis]KAH9922969.1 hypothetical protein B0H18DRAFT_1016384 [Neoantrodia serialis]
MQNEHVHAAGYAFVMSNATNSEAAQSGMSGRDVDVRTTESANEAASRSGERRDLLQEYATSPVADAKQSTTVANALSGVTLLAFPLDIIFEIFGQLCPLDLANLAQTCKTFRALLESPQSDGLWKTVKQLAGETPDGPACVPQVAWIRAMYCGYKCVGCGQFARDDVNFALLRRICFYCRRERLIEHDTFMSTSDRSALSAFVLQLIPHTSLKNDNGSAIPGKWYWSADITATTNLVLNYWKDAQEGKSAPRVALDKIKQERIRYVQAITEHATKCREWVHTRKEEEKALRVTQFKRIEELFGELGYTTEHVQKIKGFGWERHIGKACREVTEQAWQRVRIALEPRLMAGRVKRIEQGHPDTIRARMNALKTLYHDYCDQLPLRPMDRVHLPPVDMIYMTPTFRPLIYENLVAPIGLVKEQCNEAAQHFPNIISSYHASVKCALLKSMEGCTKLENSGVDMQHLLSLACSVYESYVMVGLDPVLMSSMDAVLSYLSRTREGHSDYTVPLFWLRLQASHDGANLGIFDWSMTGFSILKPLAIALGLDPNKARPEDFDELDRHVFCENAKCSDTSYGLVYFEIHSWRTIIQHCWLEHIEGPQLPVISLFSEEASAKIRCLPDAKTAQMQMKWACNHCSVHLEALQARNTVVEHVREIHGIKEPEDYIDFFHVHPEERFVPLWCTLHGLTYEELAIDT